MNKKPHKVWLRENSCPRGDPSLTVAESADQDWCPNWGKHPCINFIPRQSLDFENGFSWVIPSSAHLGKLCNPSEFEFPHLLSFLTYKIGASLITQLVKNLPIMQETPVWFLGQEDPLEKG